MEAVESYFDVSVKKKKKKSAADRKVSMFSDQIASSVCMPTNTR